METMVSVMQKVEAVGYVTQFRVAENGLQSLLTRNFYSTDDITVDHFYRFEGESSPDDEAILYAISTSSGEKGTLVDSYGASNDADVAALMRKVRGMHK